MTDTRPPASKNLVTTDWLAARLGKPGMAVVDGSFYLPALKRDAKAEFLAAHIPGAVFFDIDAVADHSTDLPHMLPGATMFSEAVGKLGISQDDTIVVYDGAGLGGAPRVWWTFRIFGAKNVFILDGGLPKWKAEGRPPKSGEAKPSPKKFEGELDTGKVANADEVSLALMNRDAQVVDARPAERFRGEAAEPRPGVRSGHMPGALNVPGHRTDRERPADRTGENRGEVQGRRRRPRPADDHELRLGRHRGNSVVRARRDRQGAQAALRRIVDRMGQPSRPAGCDKGLTPRR